MSAISLLEEVCFVISHQAALSQPLDILRSKKPLPHQNVFSKRGAHRQGGRQPSRTLNSPVASSNHLAGNPPANLSTVSGCSSTGFWSCFMTCLQDSPAMSRQKSQVLAKLSTSTSLSSAMKSFSWVCLPMVICSLDAP